MKSDNIINRLLSLFTSDETLLNSFSGEWEIYNQFQRKQDSKFCLFNVFYSKKNKKITIYYLGFEPLFHEVYTEEVVPFVQNFIKSKEENIIVSIKKSKHG